LSIPERLREWREGRKEGGKEGRKEGRKEEGGKEGRKEGRKEEGGKERRKEGGKEERKEGRNSSQEGRGVRLGESKKKKKFYQWNKSTEHKREPQKKKKKFGLFPKLFPFFCFFFAVEVEDVEGTEEAVQRVSHLVAEGVNELKGVRRRREREEGGTRNEERGTRNEE
jgi:hypothetical protein